MPTSGCWGGRGKSGGFTERCNLYICHAQAALLYVNHQSPSRAWLVCQLFIYVYLFDVGSRIQSLVHAERVLCHLATLVISCQRLLSQVFGLAIWADTTVVCLRRCWSSLRRWLCSAFGDGQGLPSFGSLLLDLFLPASLTLQQSNICLS